tara:strand:- start:14766 stop:15698 length:933 start_codon:yes stop_codon:yes gene_type:complete
VLKKIKLFKDSKGVNSKDFNFAWIFFLLILSQILFGSNQIMARFIQGEVPPIGLSFWRWVLATLIILPFTYKRIFSCLPTLYEEWKVYLASAFCLIVLGNTTIYIALNYTTAINGAIVSSVQPAFTFALSWLFYREFVSKNQIAGAVVATLGVLFIISKGDINVLFNLSPNPGDVWMVISVLGFSLYAILLKRIPDQVPAIITLNVIQFLGIILLAPLYIWETYYIQAIEFNQITLFSIIWAAVFVAIGALGLWNYTNKKLGANKASGTIHLRLIAITVMAIIVLDESLKLYHFVAFAIIMMGVFAISKK